MHIKTVKKLVAAKLAGQLATLNQGDMKFYWSITEGLEFVDIYQAFKYVAGTPDFSQKLKDALGGPADPTQETEKSNLGRNTMFELNLAAQVPLCGLPAAPSPGIVMFSTTLTAFPRSAATVKIGTP